MNYQLHHGDCLEVMPTLAANSVAMVFADIPYALPGRSLTSNSWDVAMPVAPFWQGVKHVRTANAATAMTANLRLAAVLLASNYREFKYDLVYVKSRPTRHVHAKIMPLSAHEHVLIFSARRATYNPQMTLREKPTVHGGVRIKSTNWPARLHPERVKGKIYTHRHPTTVVSIASENGQTHPTQKPLALLEWLILTYTNLHDTILDPCMGSGTTGHACANLGRKFIGIEKDATYFAAAKTRIEQAYAAAQDRGLADG